MCGFLSLHFISSFSSVSLAEMHFNNPEHGWWWYDDPEKAGIVKKIVKKEGVLSGNTSIVSTKNPCQSSTAWTPVCGFIEPHDYAFEQKEYHALLENFSVHADDLQAVQTFQQFNHWAVSQAVTAAYTWQYNNVQHPEFDHNVWNPYSEFGNLLIAHLNERHEQAFFQLLSKSALLVYFSRLDCEVCQAESRIVKRFSEETHLPVWEASLDQKPPAEHSENSENSEHATLSSFIFPNVAYVPETLKPAEILQIQWVPTLFLYLKPNSLGKSAEWIRLSTGLVTKDTLTGRLINFVEAYRHALLKGASQPDFKGSSLHPLTSTVEEGIP